MTIELRPCYLAQTTHNIKITCSCKPTYYLDNNTAHNATVRHELSQLLSLMQYCTNYKFSQMTHTKQPVSYQTTHYNMKYTTYNDTE